MSSSLGGRGIGRSYWPNERRARCPSSEPIVMPSSTGLNICMMLPSIFAVGSSNVRIVDVARSPS